MSNSALPLSAFTYLHSDWAQLNRSLPIAQYNIVFKKAGDQRNIQKVFLAFHSRNLKKLDEWTNENENICLL